MDVWQERVETSPALAAAREAKAVIEQGGANSPAEQDHLDRQYRVSDLVEWSLTNADPLLIPAEPLANLATHIRQGIEHLNAWRAGSGPEYLTTHAANQFDLVLVDLGAIPVAQAAAEAVTEIASLRRSVGQHRGQVEREIDALTAASGAAQNAATVQAEQGASRVAELEAEVQALRDELAQMTATGRDLANQQQNAFTSAQTERQEAFAKLLEEKREETAASVDAMRKQVAADASAAKAASEADVNAVSAAKLRVEEILGIVGEEALVGTYSKNATDEQKTADFFRWIAIGAIAITVGVGVWLVASAHTSGTDWDLFASKLVLGIPIGGVAAYAARQSSEHRHSQREAAHVALQLAALKPYLNDLDKVEERDQLLIEIAGRLFGHPRRDGKPDAAVVDAFAENPTLLAQLVPIVQAMSKAKG
jgi:hypothetical protein